MDYTCSNISLTARKSPFAITTKKEVDDPFSDDNGLMVRQNGTAPGTEDLSPNTNSSGALGSTSSAGRRNKRKSAAPKRRGDVLRIKRYQWLSDEESASEPEVIVERVSVGGGTAPMCAEEGDRPSSSDSGCHSFDGTQASSLANASALAQTSPLVPDTEVKLCPDNEPMDLITRTHKNSFAASAKHRDSVIRIPTKKSKIKSEQAESTNKKWCSSNFGEIPRLTTLDLNNRSSNPLSTNRLREETRPSSTNNPPLPFDLRTLGLVPSVAKQIDPSNASISNDPKSKHVSVKSRCVEGSRDFSTNDSQRVSSLPNEPSASAICPIKPGSNPGGSGSVASYVDASSPRTPAGGQPRSYYKSMSRQRRIEANARERTRVHTISAAFENLRRAVPAYADSQKLSKLAVLKIASSYILALACLNEMDYSKEQRQPTLAECVELCTQTIQSEGKARRRGSSNKE